MTLTMPQLIRAEPRLARLVGTAAEVQHDPDEESFCQNTTFARTFKPEVERLVGWERIKVREDEPEWLSSSEAYDLAYEFILDSLPRCNRCGCIPSSYGDDGDGDVAG